MRPSRNETGRGATTGACGSHTSTATKRGDTRGPFITVLAAVVKAARRRRTGEARHARRC